MTLNLPKVASESFRKMKNEGIDNKEKTLSLCILKNSCSIYLRIIIQEFLQ